MHPTSRIGLGSGGPAAVAALTAVIGANVKMHAGINLDHRKCSAWAASDGIFGRRTRAAIRRFQQTIGAETTGTLTADQANLLVTIP